MTYLVNSLVVFVPPTSGVFTLPASRVLATDFEILLANIGSPKYRSIITELSKIDVGFARFFPAKLMPE